MAPRSAKHAGMACDWLQTSAIEGAPPLGDDDIHVWYMPASTRDPREVLRAARSVRGVLLRRYARARFTPRIERGAHGKPFAPEHPALHFNLSHAGSHVLLAFASDQPLGIDLECIDRRVAPEAISARYFAPAEHAALAAMDGERRKVAFLQAWTGKEAVLKALGEGLVFGLHRVEFALDASGARLHALAPPAGPPDAWRLAGLSPAEGLIGTLAWRGGPRRLRLFTLASDATEGGSGPS